MSAPAGPGSRPDSFRFDDRMTDVEALMWRLEQLDPAFRTTMTMVVTLDVPCELDAVADRLDLMSRRIPRLRDRVAPGPIASLPPRWEPDPDFDLVRHLSRAAVAGHGTGSDLMRAAEEMLVAPFDQRHPPWHMTLVDGLEGGGQGVVMRMHHSYTDGIGAVKLALELFDLERHTAAPRPRRPRLSEVPPPRPLGRLADDVELEARRAASLYRRLVPWAASAVREAVRDAVSGSTSDATGTGAGPANDLLREIREQVREAAVPGSPIMTGRSGAVRLAAIDLPLEALRRAARRAGGTVNDAFLAGLLGGLAAYHSKHGSVPSTLRVGVPVSTRGDATAHEMRNQLEAVMIRGPLKIADPVERTRLVHEMVRHSRGQPMARLIDDATGIGLRVPGARHLVARLARSVDVVASNVPGPPVELFLAGSRVERMVPFGPRNGAGLNATLISYSTSVHIGLNLDPAAAPDTGALVDCLGAGFAELL